MRFNAGYPRLDPPWLWIGVGEDDHRRLQPTRSSQRAASRGIGYATTGLSTLRVVVVTGMSGAGRSTALRVLEDLGYYCVDNLPMPLVPEALDSIESDPVRGRVALGVDVRMGGFLETTESVLESLRREGHPVEVLFFDCKDEILVRRFSASRRPHPIAQAGDLPAGITAERERLASLRALADRIIDTTSLSVHELRDELIRHLSRGETRARMLTRVVSFGFKYGIPVDADLVFDLRFLPNPHFVEELRPQTGLDKGVAEFVLSRDESQALLDRLTDLLGYLLPRYEREGKAYLTVALGCTGGRHRSVALAEALSRRLDDGSERDIFVAHRDVERPV